MRPILILLACDRGGDAGLDRPDDLEIRSRIARAKEAKRRKWAAGDPHDLTDRDLDAALGPSGRRPRVAPKGRIETEPDRRTL